MIIEYAHADAPDTVLDVVTLDEGTDPVYETGRARSAVERMRETLGVERADEALRSWSNGYVLTREVTT